MRTAARLVVTLAVLWLPFSAVLGGSFSDPAPKEFASLTDLGNWVRAHRGFGEPAIVDTEFSGLHVFITWNWPYSGRAGSYAHTYCLDRSTGNWLLKDSSFLERPEPISFAYFDARSASVVYVGTSGAKLKAVPFKDMRCK